MQPLEGLRRFATVVIDPPWPVSQSTLQKKGRDTYKPWAYSRMPFDQTPHHDHAFITERDGDTLKREAEHRRGAQIENVTGGL